MMLMFLILLLCLCTANMCSAELKVDSSYTVVMPQDATVAESKAANVLQKYMQKVLQKPIAVVSEKDFNGDSALYVGATKFARKQGVDFTQLGQEEYIIRLVSEGNLILCGGFGRGTLYSVYDFLENFAGCRWYDEFTEKAPTVAAIVVGEVNLQRQPYFKQRWIWDRMDWFEISGEFKERNKGFSYSQGFNGMPKILGGPRPHHTFATFSADWPKDDKSVFSLNEQGERLVATSGDGPGQLCMTSPKTRELTLATLRKFIENDRKEAEAGGYPAPIIYDLSQNDNHNKCVCPKCKELAEKEGSYSAPLLDFVNYIATEIAKEYPGIYIRTFAYQYSLQPPKNIKAAKNVIIHIACLGIEFGGGYYSYDTVRSLNHPFNRETRELMERWAQTTQNIARWEYWTLYPCDPEPFVRVQAVIDDVEFSRKLNVKFTFAEMEKGWNSFFALTRYIGYKLYDNPDADSIALVADFMTHYYGKAAPKMSKLLSYMQKRQDDYNYRIAAEDIAVRRYLDDEYFAKTFKLIAEAEVLVRADEQALTHVKREKLSLISGLLNRWRHLKTPERSYDAKALLAEFETGTHELVKAYFPSNMNEFVTVMENDLKNSLIRFKSRMRKEPLPRFASAKNVVELYPESFRFDTTISKVENDVDAAGKTAVVLRSEKAENTALPVKLLLDNWMEGNRIGGVELDAKKIVQDEKYHWVDLGVMKFTNNSRAYFYASSVDGIRCDLYRLFREKSQWHCYVSIKFEGKRFVENSTKDNAMSIDRMIFVEKKEILK